MRWFRFRLGCGGDRHWVEKPSRVIDECWAIARNAETVLLKTCG